jgi:hypothetical protein
MRQFIIAAAIALGLVAVWAVILPLTAQPAPAQATSPAMSKAMFLCRGASGIDRTCAAALAKALVLDAADPAPSRASDRICPVEQQMLTSLDRRG